ncbi:hypothetical protein L8Q72_13250, partial [Enterobacter cloacae]|nr:hypothetical protein [Enterobacter cloacae]
GKTLLHGDVLMWLMKTLLTSRCINQRGAGHGQWVRMRGAFSWAAEYTYRLDKKKLTDYSLEQQASILADYWLLLVYGISKWSYYQRPGRMGMYRGVDLLQDVPSLYQKIVTGKGR